MYNRSILIGRLTAEPELKQTGTGVAVTSFSIAVDRRFGEKKADFINITAWRQQAEFICKHFRKGDPIGIEGSIQARQYEDKTGNKRTAVEVVADSVFFVGGKSQGQSGASAVNEQTGAQQVDPVCFQDSNGLYGFEEVETDDDLPF